MELGMFSVGGFLSGLLWEHCRLPWKVLNLGSWRVDLSS